MSTDLPDEVETDFYTPSILEQRPYLHGVDRTDRHVGKYELTSFFSHPGALRGWVSDTRRYFSPKAPIDAIVGLDALGFVLAGALAYELDVPMICVRKKGKLGLRDHEILSSASVKGQGEEWRREFAIRKDLLRKGMRVIVVDEWIDTGYQMNMVCEMLEAYGVEVVGAATVELRLNAHQLADSVWERWDVFAPNMSPEVSTKR